MIIDQETLDRIVEFHGHLCPGLAMGVQAAQLALREIGPHAADEEVVAVTETDMCGVDAVQVLTGCTFGKGNLIHRDWGKNAFTFYRRSDGRAVRIAARPRSWDPDPEHAELFARLRAGTADEADRARFGEVHAARSLRLLDQDPEELFEVKEVSDGPPAQARVFVSIDCEVCGEAVMETRLRQLDGRQLCPPCFEEALAAG